MTAVRVVIHPGDRAAYDIAMKGLALLDPVAGGATRQDSVRMGLESLADLAPRQVLIHDGARPLVDSEVIGRILAALRASPAAVPAIAVADTLKRAENGRIVATLSRKDLWRAQTPQGFDYAALLAAHRDAGQDGGFTDDAAIAEHAGMAVALVGGAESNFKITNEADMARAENLCAAESGEIRVGVGFDVHSFAPGRGDHVMLCGVSIPHPARLAGHSDADVGLHAVTDALLGGLGEGDIGDHFPPADPRWRGAASDIFLRHAAGLVAARGGAIVHVDLTLICEAPKLAPHRGAMVARIAEILAIGVGRVSVKATTTEGLGFTGRGEGIAAQAAATLRLPPHRVG